MQPYDNKISTLAQDIAFDCQLKQETVNTVSMFNIASEDDIMTKEKVLLFEKHDENVGGKVTEYFENHDIENGPKMFSLKGFKILAIYDSDSNLIAHHTNEDDYTDLSCLENKEGYFICCVDKNEYGTFVWNCFRVGKYLNKDIIAIVNGRSCTEDEVTLLNSIYPEYYDNAF
jgi:hypothetical protein